MVIQRKMLMAMLGCLVIFAAGCSSDDPVGPTVENNHIDLQATNMPRLPSNWTYQIWAFNDGQWVAGEEFNVDASGEYEDTLTFSELDLLNTCDSLRITMNHNTLAAGVGDIYTLIVSPIEGHAAPKLESPLKGNVSTGPVLFSFATPSDGDTSFASEMSGIWLTKNESTEPGLDSLPQLPENYVFEFWGEHDGTWLSAGQFIDLGPDQHCRYYTCGADVPPYPGEDFVNNLPIAPFYFETGDTILISIEPTDDPFPDLPFYRWRARELGTGVNEGPWQSWTLRLFSEENWPHVIAFIVND